MASYRNTGAIRLAAVAAFKDAGWTLRMDGPNRYLILRPDGFRVAHSVKRCLGGRPGEGGTVWVPEGTDYRFASPTEAAAMWALNAGELTLPDGAHEEPNGGVLARVFVDLSYEARAAIGRGELDRLQLRTILAAAIEAGNAARKALAEQYGDRPGSRAS